MNGAEMAKDREGRLIGLAFLKLGALLSLGLAAYYLVGGSDRGLGVIFLAAGGLLGVVAAVVAPRLLRSGSRRA